MRPSHVHLWRSIYYWASCRARGDHLAPLHRCGVGAATSLRPHSDQPRAPGVWVIEAERLESLRLQRNWLRIGSFRHHPVRLALGVMRRDSFAPRNWKSTHLPWTWHSQGRLSTPSKGRTVWGNFSGLAAEGLLGVYRGPDFDKFWKVIWTWLSPRLTLYSWSPPVPHGTSLYALQEFNCQGPQLTSYRLPRGKKYPIFIDRYIYIYNYRYIYIYNYRYIYIFIDINTYIYIWRERERAREPKLWP